MNNDKNRITNLVRKLRFHHGEMTQLQLAEKVGVTRQTIIAIEANRYSPSLSLAFRIARTFDAKVEDVFQFNDSDSNSDQPVS